MGSTISRVKHFRGSSLLASQGPKTLMVAEFTVEGEKILETWVKEQRGASKTLKLFCGHGRASLWLSRDESVSVTSGENGCGGKSGLCM